MTDQPAQICAPTITAADLEKCTMREDAHFNGGKVWFGYRFRCVQHPRLTRFDKYTRATRSVQSTWQVDGEDVPDLDQAAVLLSKPCEPTPEQIALLSHVPDELTLLDRRAPLLPLRDIGLVEFVDGKCRRTDAGRAALNASPAATD